MTAALPDINSTPPQTSACEKCWLSHQNQQFINEQGPPPGGPSHLRCVVEKYYYDQVK
jgi:hypothetical protein